MRLRTLVSALANALLQTVLILWPATHSWGKTTQWGLLLLGCADARLEFSTKTKVHRVQYSARGTSLVVTPFDVQ